MTKGHLNMVSGYQKKIAIKSEIREDLTPSSVKLYKE